MLQIVLRYVTSFVKRRFQRGNYFEICGLEKCGEQEKCEKLNVIVDALHPLHYYLFHLQILFILFTLPFLTYQGNAIRNFLIVQKVLAACACVSIKKDTVIFLSFGMVGYIWKIDYTCVLDSPCNSNQGSQFGRSKHLPTHTFYLHYLQQQKSKSTCWM